MQSDKIHQENILINYHTSSAMLKLQIIFFTLLLSSLSLIAWEPEILPKLIPNQNEITQRYFGNNGVNKSEYFKLLDYDQTSILLGGRNAIYNISIHGLRENYKLEWLSSVADRELCALKGKFEEDCQNYIRVFARTTDSQVMICGTNSYKPRCRYYSLSGNVADGHFEVVKELEAQGLCPYSPTHNSTYVFTDNQLYSATVADFSGSDPLIYRENLRTEQYDLKQLNQPDFVGAVERNGYVFFFFREISMEYMNCGKAIYSRVGRICKNDRGGPYTLSKSWTSFLKTRLNCSIPGEYPFYFDEIQAVSDIIETRGKANNSTDVIYAVFTTSVNAIPGSAICAFSLNDILVAFEGRFKSQKDSNSNWLPIQAENVPEPRPGSCVDDSRTLSSTSVNFVKNHPLMEIAVPALFGRPLLTKVRMDHRMTSIAIDPNVMGLDKTPYNIIYIGTDNGRVMKLINLNSVIDVKETSQTIIIFEMQVLTLGTPVKELIISHETQTLIVISDNEVISVPLNHCTSMHLCESCINLQDPSCVWDINNHECKQLLSTGYLTSVMLESYIQNVNTTIKNTKRLCRKYTDVGNRIDLKNGPFVSQSTRGTVSGVGKKLSSYDELKRIESETKTILESGGFITGIYNDQNKIILSSVDASDLTNSVPGLLNVGKLNNDEKEMQLANVYWIIIFIALPVIFVIGMVVGYTFRYVCKSSAFQAEHRNQLNSKSRTFINRGNGKDVNLLVNSNIFQTAPCNNKKDNIEHEFVSQKDRSHECKNSTENLEKEIPCKTSTLSKVKRTYI